MVLPILLLQKPSSTSKEKNHSEILAKRIEKLKNGGLEETISESRNIQRNLRPRKINGNLSKSFAKLLMHGKMNAALRLLSDEQSSGVLELSENVIYALKKKQPHPASIKHDSFLYGPLGNNKKFTFH